MAAVLREWGELHFSLWKSRQPKGINKVSQLYRKMAVNSNKNNFTLTAWKVEMTTAPQRNILKLKT
jgi:hypothetical protein